MTPEERDRTIAQLTAILEYRNAWKALAADAIAACKDMRGPEPWMMEVKALTARYQALQDQG